MLRYGTDSRADQQAVGENDRVVAHMAIINEEAVSAARRLRDQGVLVPSSLRAMCQPLEQPLDQSARSRA